MKSLIRHCVFVCTLAVFIASWGRLASAQGIFGIPVEAAPTLTPDISTGHFEDKNLLAFDPIQYTKGRVARIPPHNTMKDAAGTILIQTTQSYDTYKIGPFPTTKLKLLKSENNPTDSTLVIQNEVPPTILNYLPFYSAAPSLPNQPMPADGAIRVDGSLLYNNPYELLVPTGSGRQKELEMSEEDYAGSIAALNPYSNNHPGIVSSIMANEDAVIKGIAGFDLNGQRGLYFGGAVSPAYPPEVTEETFVPMSTCAHIEGNGPIKIVFMRGSSMNDDLNDFLGIVRRIIQDGFQKIDPFKTYYDNLSFYVDLQKIPDVPGKSPDADSIKRVSECAGNFYYYFLSDPTNDDGRSYTYIGYPAIYMNFQGDFKATIVPASIHELGHAFGHLDDEYTEGSVEPTFGVNCTLNPLSDYRSLLDNRLYGSTNSKGCTCKQTNFCQNYFRPNDTSIMSNGNIIDKFNVIDCGYLVAALKREQVIKANGQKYWPDCLKMDTDKDGIPPVQPAPLITAANVDTTNDQQLLVTIKGSGFDPDSSHVQIYSDAKTYDFPNITVDDSAVGQAPELTFIVPAYVSFGKYKLHAAAANSPWSNDVPIEIKQIGPHDLFAEDTPPDVSRIGVRLKWAAPNLSDIKSFRVEREVNEDGVFNVVGQADPSVTPTYDDLNLRSEWKYTYRVIAEYKDGTESEPSNEVTFQPAKPVIPLLTGTLNGLHEIDLSIPNAADVYKRSPDIRLVVSKVNSKGEILSSAKLDPGQTQAISDLLFGDSVYCYIVQSEILKDPDSNTLHLEESKQVCLKTPPSTDMKNVTVEPQPPIIAGQDLTLEVNNDNLRVNGAKVYLDGVQVYEMINLYTSPFTIIVPKEKVTVGNHSVFVVVSSADTTSTAEPDAERRFQTNILKIVVPATAQTKGRNPAPAESGSVVVSDTNQNTGFLANFRTFVGDAVNNIIHTITVSSNVPDLFPSISPTPTPSFVTPVPQHSISVIPSATPSRLPTYSQTFAPKISPITYPTASYAMTPAPTYSSTPSVSASPSYSSSASSSASPSKSPTYSSLPSYSSSYSASPSASASYSSSSSASPSTSSSPKPTASASTSASPTASPSASQSSSSSPSPSTSASSSASPSSSPSASKSASPSSSSSASPSSSASSSSSPSPSASKVSYFYDADDSPFFQAAAAIKSIMSLDFLGHIW